MSNSNLVLTLDITNNTTIKLAFTLGISDNAVINWGDSTSTNVSTSIVTHTYVSGTYTVSISGNLTGFNGFYDNNSGANYLTEINSWGSLGLINLDSACNNIPDIPIPTSIPNTVKSTRRMFENSFYNRSDISTWDVSRITDMSYMFNNSFFNKDISQWFITSVVDVSMNYMFVGEPPFTQDLSRWNVISTKRTSFSNFIYYRYLPTFIDGKRIVSLTCPLIDTTSARITWSGSYNQVKITYGTKTLYAINTNTYTFTDLSPGTTYNVQVYGCNNGWTIGSNIVTLSTFPLPPTDLSAVAIDASAVRLTWRNSTVPDSTIVQYAIPGNPLVFTAFTGFVDISSARVTIPNQAGSLIQFRVYTVKNGLVSVVSNTISASLLPLAPTILSAVSIDNTKIQLTWRNSTVPDSTILEYGINQRGFGMRYLTYTGFVDLSSAIFSVSHPLITVQSTVPFRIYTVKNGVSSAVSNTVNGTYFTFPPLTSLSIVNTWPNAIMIKWDSISVWKNLIIEYQVGSNTTWINYPYSRSQFDIDNVCYYKNYLLTGLLPGTYTIRVISIESPLKIYPPTNTVTATIGPV
jgi:hypothetical protein